MRSIGLSSLIALILAASAPLALADDKLDGNDKKWLAQVSALIQSDEQTIYKKIPKADRAEFQVIFWARRNPQGPSAPTNEVKERFLRSAAEADKKFSVPGAAGASTGCGRVYLLLGPPDQVKPLGAAGDDAMRATDLLGMPGRTPELWTYKDRPGLTFPGGQVTIAFDNRCEFPVSGALSQRLAELAATRIATPDIKPEVGPDGHLVSLVDLLKRKRTPAQMLFVSPRQDFTLEQQQKLMMRVPTGTYVAGLLRIPVAGLAPKEAGGTRKVALLVVTQLVDAAGKVVHEMDGARTAEVKGDDRVVISYSTAGPPGSYTLRIAVSDPASDKGAVMEMPVTLPDYASSGLKLSDPQVFAGINQVQQPDPQDPFADFLMGSVRLLPRFGNVFKKSENVQFLCLGYNATPDPVTHKPATTVRFEVLKGDKLVTAGTDMAIDSPDFTPAVGPIPLGAVEPGQYRLKAVVSDNVAKQQLTASTTYEVVP